MKYRLKSAIRSRFPATLIIKAWLVAWKDSLSAVSDSYSQTGEDSMLLELFRKKGVTKGRYIDVGANHPTKLSNPIGFTAKVSPGSWWSRTAACCGCTA
jgi:hypothetical protein